MLYLWLFLIKIMIYIIGYFLDLAIKILSEDKTLAIAEDGNGETILHLLAKKQLVFSHDAQGFWVKNG